MSPRPRPNRALMKFGRSSALAAVLALVGGCGHKGDSGGLDGSVEPEPDASAWVGLDSEAVTEEDSSVAQESDAAADAPASDGGGDAAKKDGASGADGPPAAAPWVFKAGQGPMGNGVFPIGVWLP